MKAKICIVLILISQLLLINSLRNLDDVKFKVDVSVNDEYILKDGILDLQQKYICVHGGTPSNSIFTREPAEINGEYCFPHLYISAIFSRFNPFTQFFYFRIHSAEGSGYSDNLQVKYYFKGNQVADLDAMFKGLTQQIVDTKADAKKITDILFDRANNYNNLSTKLSTGNKSIPEIQSEIDDYNTKITATKSDLQAEQINYNNLSTTCSTLQKEHNEEIAILQDLNDKAENLDNTINNNKISIDTFDTSLVNNEKAIANAKDRIHNAQTNYREALSELKTMLPTESEKLDDIDKKVVAKDLAGANTVIDSFVNIL